MGTAMIHRRTSQAIAIGLLAAASLSSCAGASEPATGTEGGPVERTVDVSRVKLYPSPKALAKDSAAVIVGTVAAQRTAADVTPDTDFTISTVTVVQVSKSATGVVVPGGSIDVRQIGSAEEEGTPPPSTLMSPGETYLIYLTPSGLGGELASQFYVTGGNAGLYAQDLGADLARSAAPAGFTKVDPEPGEKLPERMTISESLG